MTDFLRAVLGASLTGGVFILAAVLVRAGVRNRLPKRFLVLLWAAVLAHLLMLVWAPSPTSIYNYIGFHHPEVLEEAIYQGPASTPPAPVPSVEPPLGTVSLDSPSPASSGGRVGVLTIVWLAGVVVLGVVFVSSFVAGRRRFADAILLKGNLAVDRWRLRRKRPVQVYVSDRTTTPLSCGLFRPRIVLPLDFEKANAAQLESVLEHEYVHGSNYHNVMKVLVGVAVAVHWFNPAVWLFWLLFNHDIELACDELVLRNLGADRRAEYAHSLVAVAERAVVTLPLVSAFNARNLRERIVDVMGFKRSSGLWLVPEVLLVTALFAVFGTAPAVSLSLVPQPTSTIDAVEGDVAAVPTEFAEWTYPSGADPLDMALSIAGGGIVVKNEIDRKNGKETAEFKIVSGNFEHTIRLDTAARTMVKYERKEVKRPLVPDDLAGVIPVEEARRVAVQATGGGQAVGIELKRTKAGIFVYKVKVVQGGGKYEVEMNAVDGRILDVDRD